MTPELALMLGIAVWLVIRKVCMRFPLFLLLLLLASPVWAQPRTILQIPVNFQDDTSQPRTLAELKADGEASIAKLLFENSYGAVTATSTVWEYLTVPMNKGCPQDRGILPVMNMSEFNTKVIAGLAARGQTMTGFTYIYIVSPTTFGKCSHDDRYGFAPHAPLSSGDHLTFFAWRLTSMRALNWACKKVSDSTWVTFGEPPTITCGPSSSTAFGRDYTSFTGQGNGDFSAPERQQLGWLPATQQVTVTADQWQGTITRLENPAAGVKRVLHPGAGVEFEYHAPRTSKSWDSRGVTGHVLNASKRLDFTPDNFDRLGSTALEPGASSVINGFRFTNLKSDLDIAVLDVRKASDPLPAPLVEPRCAMTSPDPSINVTTLTDATCGTWSIDSLQRVFRNPGGFFGYASGVSFCDGVVYIEESGRWSRIVTGTSGVSAAVSMNTPARPACMGAAPVAHPVPSAVTWAPVPSSHPAPSSVTWSPQ